MLKIILVSHANHITHEEHICSKIEKFFNLKPPELATGVQTK